MGYTEKLSNGRWKGTYRTPDGRERSRSFARKIDADTFWRNAEADKVRGEWIDPRLGRQTFGEFAEVWRAAQVHDEATADDRLGVVDVDVLAALRARNADVDAVAAGLVQEVHWRGRQIGPPVPPLHERRVDREQRPSFVR